jgi:hypothetical protein
MTRARRRKQVELLKGVVVLKAQECQKVLSGGYREDLFRELVSADAVFRRPLRRPSFVPVSQSDE